MTSSLRFLFIILSHRTRNLVWHVGWEYRGLKLVRAFLFTKLLCICFPLGNVRTALETFTTPPYLIGYCYQSYFGKSSFPCTTWRQRFCCLVTQLSFKTSCCRDSFAVFRVFLWIGKWDSKSFVEYHFTFLFPIIVLGNKNVKAAVSQLILLLLCI